ncbi:unnamed protein product [Peronospora belbahrii]|uniref:Integrase catalytic domain-containing protein n=1 Tax=Peronospora belbahrii TaxID=622444 RepID=A0AAU9KLW9_9STRA|nr:unnamed protein product [Peronospora belbahrii]
MLELVHTDVMGPMRTLTKGGAKYVLMLVDDSSREPMFLVEDGLDADVEHHYDWSDRLRSPKRAGIDEEGLLAEAVLAYAASIDGVSDTPNTYAEAIASDKASERRQAVDAELQLYARNQTWTFVPRETATRLIGCRWFLPRNANRTVE